jgi:hypothetical protein
VRTPLSLTSLALWGVSPPAWASADTSTAALVAGFSVAAVFGLAGLVLGLVLSARRRAVPVEPLVAAGPPTPSAWPDGVPRVAGRQVWRGGDAAARSRAALAVSVRLAGRGPVLLLPDPAGRAAALAGVQTAPGVRWLEPNRPDAGAVYAGLNTLNAQGSSTVILDGASATADPETTRALLHDLGVPVVLLLEAGAAAPDGLAVTELSAAALAALTG